MKTYRITENEIKGMKVLATGYKAFKNDWTTKHGDYSYADENGEVLNSIHKVDGELIMCENGLHFAYNPMDCFNYYESAPWTRFAKVEAYGELLNEVEKSSARILKIIKTYTFDGFINEIKETRNGGYGVWGVWGGNDVTCSDAIYGGNEIYGGTCIRGGNNIYGCDYIRGGDAIRGSNDVIGGHNIRGGSCIGGGTTIYGSRDIYGSHSVCSSFAIYGCYGIQYSSDVLGSNDIAGGAHIRGGSTVCGSNDIYGGSDIWGARNCEGVSKCIFCYNFTGKLHAFNKPITKERFEEIRDKLNSFGWAPEFTNATKLKGNKKWEETNIPEINSVSNKEAWSAMPAEMKAYIKSLPEFDEAIFKAITED